MNTIGSYLRSMVAFVLQVLTLVYTVPVGTLIMGIRAERPKNFSMEPGTLIISNHQSKSDPFFIVRHLGWNNYVHNLPIRFPVTPYFMTMPIIGHYLWLLHCFNVGSSNVDRAKALVKMRGLLQQRKTVMLFPEGRCIKEGNSVETFHRGIDILLTEDTPLVLVRLRNFNSWSPWHRKHRPTMQYYAVPRSLTLEQKRAQIARFYGDESEAG